VWEKASGVAKSGDLIVGLDIGTTKTLCVVAEAVPDELPSVIGMGVSSTAGLYSGSVVNMEDTVGAIREAVASAERMVGVQVEQVYAGIMGEHVYGHNGRGTVAVSGPGNEITSGDVDRVLAQAEAITLPDGREVLHVLPRQFIVDDQQGIREPLGITGTRLEADVHVVTAQSTPILTLERGVERAGFAVRGMVLEPLASSYAVLTPDEKQLGCVLVDIGGGTTDLAVFFRGSIWHTAVVPLGGNNVTEDIAVGLEVPVACAEKLKCERGSALAEMVDDDEQIEIEASGDDGARSVSRTFLAEIIEARMEEIFQLTCRELRRAECIELLGSGMILTGGGTLLDEVVDVARKIFGRSVRVGTPRGVRMARDDFASPMYATGVGLVVYGLEALGVEGRQGRVRKGWSGRLGAWLRDFF
jgi:cell division protein FtsA